MLLSICIPSYNRFNKLIPTIQQLLKSNSQDFEVVVVDNCSTDDIGPLLAIRDSRLRVIQRKKVVYGPENVSSSLAYAAGEYAMLCLDKDRVDGRYIDEFINILKGSRDICGGICKLMGMECRKEQVKILQKDPILKIGYLNRHPSGSFYKNSILQELFKGGIKSWILRDPFSYEFLSAVCAERGKMMLYYKTLVFVESREDAVAVKSLSFREGDKSLFFFPQNRINEFIRQLYHLNRLNIPMKIKEKMAKILYVRTFKTTLFGYRDCMNNKVFCQHYQIKPRRVHFEEMDEYRQNLNKVWKSQNIIKMSKMRKEIIMVHCDLKFYKRWVLHKIVNMIGKSK